MEQPHRAWKNRSATRRCQGTWRTRRRRHKPRVTLRAGYAACFLGAVKVAGQKLRVRIPSDAAAPATVGIGASSEDGVGITAEFGIRLPDVDQTQARQVVDLAHQICPYSNAKRNNLSVNITCFDVNVL